MLHDDIHELYMRHVQPDGRVTKNLAGRFMVTRGQLHHLEDYHGLLQQLLPAGPVGNMQIAVFQGLKKSPYLQVISRNDVLKGKHLDELPEAEIPDPPEPHEVESRPSSVFEYHRAGMDKPHILEVKGNRLTLDGNELHPDEAKQISQNVMSGAASLRYKQGAKSKIAKMERALLSLFKNDEDEDLDEKTSFAHLQAAVEAGHLDPRVLSSFRKLVYEDKMVPGIGNKHAYETWKEQPRPGVHVALDGNSFKQINDVHGHDAGDAAIKAFGKVAREAIDETMGVEPGKRGKLFRTPDMQQLYRNGGDEFMAHFPTHEHAARFARVLRAKLDEIPPINGVHKLSMSFGFGHDHQSADEALYQAKAAKKAHMAANGLHPGQEPSFAHSLVPGAEGPVPLSEPHPMNAPGMDQKPVQPPKL